MPLTHQLPRSVSALDEIFSLLEKEYRRHEIDERSAYCVSLAAEELFTNMVRHNVVGDSDRISFEIEVTDERIRLLLVDHDVEPWDPDSAPLVDPDLPMEAREPGGLGIYLVRSMVDKISYEYRDREMRVEVIKKRVR